MTSTQQQQQQKHDFVIFTCTWYPHTDDLRFKQCLATISTAVTENISIVIVDGSPIESNVTVALRDAGAIVYEQTFKGGKGAALREAATKAHELPHVTDDTLLCWMEPEKTHMISLYSHVYEQINDDDDVVIPYRHPDYFSKSYPIEQYHSETYGNYYLDTVMRNEITKQQQEMADIAAPSLPRLTTDIINDTNQPQRKRQPILIDWHFGPFAFRARHVSLWTTYDGPSYDAQLVPIVHAMRKGLTVASVPVRFELDARMKEQEEGSVAFIEKRLRQLSDLDPRVVLAWREEFYC